MDVPRRMNKLPSPRYGSKNGGKREGPLRKAAAAGTTETGSSPRVVDIVDDDPSVRRALTRLLSSVRLRSRGYGSARVYLESADRESTACLLLDVHLPGMSGIELLEHLSELTPALPVICVTGRGEPDVEQRVSAVGSFGCLRKPFDEAELFEAITKSSGIPIPSASA